LTALTGQVFTRIKDSVKDDLLVFRTKKPLLKIDSAAVKFADWKP